MGRLLSRLEVAEGLVLDKVLACGARRAVGVGLYCKSVLLDGSEQCPGDGNGLWQPCCFLQV